MWLMRHPNLKRLPQSKGVMMIFEVCVDSAEGAAAARQGGAQRVELCADLVEGGITPSYGMVKLACQVGSIGVNVIIRPRGGDFCYTDLEFEIMREDIQMVKQLGASGVVIGLLLPDGSIDMPRVQNLAALARPMSVTFHRAFDVCADPGKTLDQLITLGIDRLLTSGQKPSALDGVECIQALVRQARERMVIMAGGGVNEHTLAQIVKRSGVKEVHFSARSTLESPMSFRNPLVTMGKAYQPDEYLRKATDVSRVEAVIKSWS
jgi:copper homeostasis protein